MIHEPPPEHTPGTPSSPSTRSAAAAPDGVDLDEGEGDDQGGHAQSQQTRPRDPARPGAQLDRQAVILNMTKVFTLKGIFSLINIKYLKGALNTSWKT